MMEIKDYINSLILIVTIVAVYYGPVRAIEISSRIEEKRQKRQEQWTIFTNLMRFRKISLDALHVTSLNLIDVVFHDNEKVVAAHRKYMNFLMTVLPDDQPLIITEKFVSDRGDAFVELVSEMGKHLGLKLDKSDIKKYGYAPQGWATAEEQILQFRKLMNELLSGQRGLPIKQFLEQGQQSKYPPPPSVADTPNQN